MYDDTLECYKCTCTASSNQQKQLSTLNSLHESVHPPTTANIQCH